MKPDREELIVDLVTGMLFGIVLFAFVLVLVLYPSRFITTW